MIDKDKFLRYLNTRIENLKKEDIDNRKLSNDCIGKHIFTEATSRELRAFEEIKAIIEVGLMEVEEGES